MIKVKNHIGEITLSQQYFEQLIANTVINCFGVAGVNTSTPAQTLMAFLPAGKKHRTGITVKVGKDKLAVDLHITVMYGVNVGAVVKSIINKLRYVVEENTGIAVEKVGVFVDNVKM